MFINKIAIKHHKKNVVQRFKEKSDDDFLTLLTHTRVILFSFLTYQKNHLTYEERIEFGLYDDISKAFNNIKREEFLNTYIYILVNYTNTFEQEAILQAYDLALQAYKSITENPTEKDNADFFRCSKKRIIQQYLNEKVMNEEQFFDLYSTLAKKYALTKKEVESIKKELKNNFADLLVWQLTDILNNEENSNV